MTRPWMARPDRDTRLRHVVMDAIWFVLGLVAIVVLLSVVDVT